MLHSCRRRVAATDAARCIVCMCMSSCMVKVLVFVGVGGREQSSQICVTPWYVSTGGIIFYTKKNRFENSCTYVSKERPKFSLLWGHLHYLFSSIEGKSSVLSISIE